jgi:hypothetical protein
MRGGRKKVNKGSATRNCHSEAGRVFRFKENNSWTVFKEDIQRLKVFGKKPFQVDEGEMRWSFSRFQGEKTS